MLTRQCNAMLSTIITDILQEQSMGRHAFSGLGAFLAFNHMTELIHRHAPASHLDQGAYHSPHHVTQKAVGGDDEIPFVVASLNPAGLSNVAERGLHIGMALAECPEYLVFQQSSGGHVHGIKVERVMGLPRIRAKERNLASMYIIMVRAAGGREAGMNVIGNSLHPVNSYIAG